MSTPKTSEKRLALEWALLFIGTPALVWWDPFGWRIFPYFVPMVVYLLLVYPRCREARLRRNPAYKSTGAWWRLLVTFALLCLGAVLLVPERFFYLPRHRPELFLMILLAYPFISALPQEFMYRQVFFARYKALFPTARSMVLASTLSFAWLHVAYGWVTVLLCLYAGWSFSDSYQKSGSLRVAWLEHVLYGYAVFAVGWGQLFYKP
jgi:hypothetical protein